MSKRNTTIKDVAKNCGVSVATVSRVLNDNYFVTPETKAKVLQAVKELGYVPNSAARSLKMNTSGIIGYITSDISNGYHILIAKGIEDIIRPYNYNLIVSSTSNSGKAERQYLELLMGKNIDALVLNTSGKNDDYILEINKSLPMVMVNRRLKTPGFHGDFADCNNKLGMYLLTRKLLEAGHRRIYLLQGSQHLSNTQERNDGFFTALAEAHIPAADYPYVFEGDYGLESGAEAIKQMHTLPEQPTAVIAENNQMTLGALKELNEQKISVPDELSVAGFNGIDHLELMNVRPTVADFDSYKIGCAAGKAILERIKDNSIENREYIFGPEIIEGNSIRTL